MNIKETSIHIVLMVDNLILIALKMYSLLQVTQILQKMRLNVFWKKTIGTEMQEIKQMLGVKIKRKIYAWFL